MSEAMVTREHKAGLELARQRLAPEINDEKLLDELIAQASAAPEQEPTYIVPASVGWYGYGGGHVDTKYAPDVWKVVEHLESLLDAIPTEPLYTHADPSEVERLRAELVESQKQLKNQRASTIAQIDAHAETRQKLDEAQALLREVHGWIDRTSLHGTDAVDLMVNINAFLSATAQPAEVKS